MILDHTGVAFVLYTVLRRECMLALSQGEKQKVVFSWCCKPSKLAGVYLVQFQVWNLVFCCVEDSRQGEWLVVLDDEETHSFS